MTGSHEYEIDFRIMRLNQLLEVLLTHQQTLSFFGLKKKKITLLAMGIMVRSDIIKIVQKAMT
jgi:hypothetical protein